MNNFSWLRYHLIALPLLVTSVVLALDPGIAISSSPLIIFLNAFPLTLCALSLWCLTGRFFLTSLLSSLCLIGLHYANALKFHHLGIPLIAADLMLISQLTNNMDLFKEYLSPAAYGLVGGGLASLLMLTAKEQDALRCCSVSLRATMGGVCLLYRLVPL